jgi:GAF domain-containing protein
VRALVYRPNHGATWAFRTLKSDGIVEAVSVPLAEDGEVIGILTAGYRTTGAIDSECRHFLEVLGAFIARVAVARRALERSQREAAEQRIVGAVAAAAATEQDAARAVAVLNVQLADRIPQVVTCSASSKGTPSSSRTPTARRPFASA